jgi:hypothetical protein
MFDWLCLCDWEVLIFWYVVSDQALICSISHWTNWSWWVPCLISPIFHRSIFVFISISTSDVEPHVFEFVSTIKLSDRQFERPCASFFLVRGCAEYLCIPWILYVPLAWHPYVCIFVCFGLDHKTIDWLCLYRLYICVWYCVRLARTLLPYQYQIDFSENLPAFW